jgi:hypothetical protein
MNEYEQILSDTTRRRLCPIDQLQLCRLIGAVGIAGVSPSFVGMLHGMDGLLFFIGVFSGWYISCPPSCPKASESRRG